MKKIKGFTLIELLVVIAIIGILAGILLVSLSGARSQGRDTRVISGLNQWASLAESIYASQQSYKGLSDAVDGSGGCVTISGGTLSQYIKDSLKKICDDIRANNGGAANIVFLKNGTDVSQAQTYCMSSKLNDGSTYCIDSTKDTVKGKKCEVASELATCTATP